MNLNERLESKKKMPIRTLVKGVEGQNTMSNQETSIPSPVGDRLLTLREVAEVLQLSPRTVRVYVQRGDIDGRIIGGRWRFRRADLDAFFANAPRNWDFARNDNHGE